VAMDGHGLTIAQNQISPNGRLPTTLPEPE